jgi:Mg2+ and Co2+ transporter CorA
MHTVRTFWPLAVLALGYVAGSLTSSPPAVRAGVRDEPTQQRAFQIAEERMEPVVREMATVLQRIDKRLETIETVIKKQAEKQQS